jgi:uncharacterized protein
MKQGQAVMTASTPHRRAVSASAGMLVVLWVFAVGAVCAAERPSFDCAKATTPTERAICADEALAVLDREIADLYRRRRAKSPAPRVVDGSQKQWLAIRDACKEDLACLKKEHTARKEALEEEIARFAKAPSKDTSGFSGVYAHEFGSVEIEAVSATEFDVSINNVERTNARWVCDFSGTGRLKNGAIVIDYKPETEGYEPITVTLRRKGDRLTVTEKRESQADFCGHNGYIEGTYLRKN